MSCDRCRNPRNRQDKGTRVRDNVEYNQCECGIEDSLVDHAVDNIHNENESLEMENEALREALIEYVKRSRRLLDNYADGDDNVKRTLWRSLHELADPAQELIESERNLKKRWTTDIGDEDEDGDEE